MAIAETVANTQTNLLLFTLYLKIQDRDRILNNIYS